MKQLRVIVKDRNTLVLEENGEKGDQINLAELANVDFTAIEDIILRGKDQVYEKKLKELKEQLLREKEAALKIQKLNLDQAYDKEVTKLKEVINTNELNSKLKIEKSKKEYDSERNEIIRNFETLKATFDQKVENERLLLEQKYANEISSLKNQLSELKPLYEIETMRKVQEYEEKINQLKLEHSEELNKRDSIINEKELRYQELQNRKASLNIKMIGEGLETWCDNEMNSYMQNGFLNCKWFKDNKPVKSLDETNGTKADFIFNIYANELRNESELLTSVCLEMKDENPNSIHRKKNAEYLATLDKNRIKKGCKYAILVSNLELDNPNDLPILKVRDYDDMYIVRPAYMIVLLNMITSLTTNFKSLLLETQKEALEVKARTELLEEFEALKKMYLENELESLAKNIETIRTKSVSIIKVAEDIDSTCNTIVSGCINRIQKKLDTFQVKITKEYKKFERSGV